MKNVNQTLKKIISGEKLGIPGEENIIAYRDWSMSEKAIASNPYFSNLDRKHQEEKLIFYAPKKPSIEETLKRILNEKQCYRWNKKIWLIV